ncbi:MAG: hypothetical protein HWQ35_15150 [Nostoc sp. NMS1]|uniref:hypothetical protein n=1 Tax=unclassified Nostoc TaxID=2593658 RepID=UPI0025F37AEF|nr:MULTISPECIES: hypothetical protein [unclassified Nostoc]MBN3907843.1 hypothetical protein [Nostoc sp. NMS1]MBN3991146.1 hypothetical protein [Nostoc sp. NMS2]
MYFFINWALGIGHGEEAGEQGREYKITSFSSAPFPLPLCLSLISRLVSEVEPHPPHHLNLSAYKASKPRPTTEFFKHPLTHPPISMDF